MRKFVGIVIEGEEFLLDVEDVLQVIQYDVPTPIPGTHELFEGLLPYKGEALPVVNITPIITGSKKSGGRYIVVLKDGDGLGGFKVDGITQLYEVADEDCSYAEGVEFMKEVVHLGNRKLFVLNDKKILDKIFGE